MSIGVLCNEWLALGVENAPYDPYERRGGLAHLLGAANSGLRRDWKGA